MRDGMWVGLEGECRVNFMESQGDFRYSQAGMRLINHIASTDLDP